MQATNGKKMNRVTISIPRDIDLSFRQKAAIKFAFKRGWYGKAILEAIEFWITHHTGKTKEITEDTKNYLWKKVRDNIDIDDSCDPQDVLESVVDYFNRLKFVENIRYEMDEQKILIRKEGPLESYAPYLITREDESIYFNCPVKAIAGAALKEFTGNDYDITSNKSLLLYVYDKSKFLDNKLQQEKSSAVYSSQLL